MRLIPLILSAVFLLQCSIIHVKDREPKVKIKDTSFAARKGSELKKRIVVLPFINLSTYKSELFVEEARTEFLNEVAKADETVNMEPRAAGLDNLAPYMNGNSYKLDELAKKLRNTGIHAIIIGTVKDMRTGKHGDSVGFFRKVKADVKAVVELQVVSARTGQVMATETADADMSETQTRIAERSFTDADLQDTPGTVKYVVETAFEKTINGMLTALQKFSWEGRVALVKGERVYLNAGRLSGLQLGDILRIVEPQEEVFDPETSQFIGNIKGRVKGSVEVVSYFGTDGAVTQIHSGSGFKENDLVEFY